MAWCSVKAQGKLYLHLHAYVFQIVPYVQITDLKPFHVTKICCPERPAVSENVWEFQNRSETIFS